MRNSTEEFNRVVMIGRARYQRSPLTREPMLEKQGFQDLESSMASAAILENDGFNHFTKSEVLAEKLLEKVQQERQRISAECEIVRLQLSQMLSNSQYSE